MKIYITQLIYLNEGEENTFHQFEEVAIPIISKYNGKLLLRTRINEKDIIEKNMEQPYEIHLVEFPSDKDFNDFAQDEERKKFLHLKERAIKTVLLIKGIKI